MSKEIALSYVLTTRNRMEMLPLVMEDLLAQIQPDEEIIVIDANSSDGTPEYLQSLKEDGRIHRFVSEPDHGEGHGFNKGLLMARGQLIKVVSDDDAFYWPAVQACKSFMLQHAAIDFMGGNSAHTTLDCNEEISMVQQFELEYRKWLRDGRKPIFFNGLPIMLRRASLPLTGLFDTSCQCVDLEFTVRVSRFANLAWCTGVVAVRILHPGSKLQGSNAERKLSNEFARMKKYYGWIRPEEEAFRQRQGLKERVKRVARLVLRPIKRPFVPVPTPTPERVPFAGKYQTCMAWLAKTNANHSMEFLCRDRKHNGLRDC